MGDYPSVFCCKQKVMSKKRKRRTKRKKSSNFKKRIEKFLRNKQGKYAKYIVVLLTLAFIILVAKGFIFLGKMNGTPTVTDDKIPYQIRGVDVSSYQGKIDWEKIRQQGIAFAYIKASEGKSYVDPEFKHNWYNAGKAGIVRGAYHFMRFEIDGVSQGQHFVEQMSSTQDTEKMLPPVIDVEFHGKYIKHPPNKENLHQVLSSMIKTVEKKCGISPVIYTNRHIYTKYINGKYNNEIWIADPDLGERLPSGKKWLFCQYSISGKLKGYRGVSSHIDLDVYNGTKYSFVKRFK